MSTALYFARNDIFWRFAELADEDMRDSFLRHSPYAVSSAIEYLRE